MQYTPRRRSVLFSDGRRPKSGRLVFFGLGHGVWNGACFWPLKSGG